MNFAVISGNNVVNVIVADSKEIAEEVTNLLCIEYTDENPAGIGWTYDGVNFIGPGFIEVVSEETPEDPA
jgi:hypothetical protein